MAERSLRTPIMYQPLHDIATFCLNEWRQVHEGAGHDAAATMTCDVLTVTLQNALTCADIQLTRSSPGRIYVLQQVIQRFNQLYPRLALLVEQRLDCFVAASEVEVDYETGAITFLVTLRDVQRMPSAVASPGGTVGTLSALPASESRQKSLTSSSQR